MKSIRKTVENVRVMDRLGAHRLVWLLCVSAKVSSGAAQPQEDTSPPPR